MGHSTLSSVNFSFLYTYSILLPLNLLKWLCTTCMNIWIKQHPLHNDQIYERTMALYGTLWLMDLGDFIGLSAHNSSSL